MHTAQGSFETLIKKDPSLNKSLSSRSLLAIIFHIHLYKDTPIGTNSEFNQER